jgi:AcrR family transcriptional regulator
MATQKQPTRQEREWQARRQIILGAAAELYLEHGFAGTTMHMIAEKAEFSVGYLYRHFPGKKEMLDEIIESHLEEFERTRRLTNQTTGGGSLRAIRADVAHWAAQAARNAHLVPLFLSYQENDRKRVREFALACRHELSDHFQAAMNEGLIRWGEPDLLAAVLDGVVWGLIQTMADTGATHRFEDIPMIVDDLVIEPLLTEKGKDKLS